MVSKTKFKVEENYGNKKKEEESKKKGNGS